MLYKINLEYIRNINVKPKTTRILKKYIGENFCVLRLGKDFLNAIRKV